MATQFTDELQIEAPPSKRARLERSEDTHRTTMDVTEDNHRTAASPTALEISNSSGIEPTPMVALENAPSNMNGIPGLGLLGQAPLGEQRSTSRGKSLIKQPTKSDRLI